MRLGVVDFAKGIVRVSSYLLVFGEIPCRGGDHTRTVGVPEDEM